MQSRGCPLKGLAGTPDLAAHRQRFTANGWQRAEALDMDTIHRCHLDPLERHRRAPAAAQAAAPSAVAGLACVRPHAVPPAQLA